MATKKSNNILTIGNLKNAIDKKFSQRNVSILIDGKTYNILVDEHIMPSKLDLLVDELFSKSIEIKEKGIELNINDYMYYLLVKYFTNLSIANNSTSLEEQIQILYYLINLNVLESIISVFDQNELNELFPIASKKYIQTMATREMQKKSEADPSIALGMLGIKSDELDKISAMAKELNEASENNTEVIEETIQE